MAIDQILYVSHPFSGNEDNRKAIDVIIKDLVRFDPNVFYLSPLHAMRREYKENYTKEEYDRDLSGLLLLLIRCEGIIMCGDWETSKGCTREFNEALCRQKVTRGQFRVYESLPDYYITRALADGKSVCIKAVNNH